MNRSASRSLTPEKHPKSQVTTEPKSPNKLIPADKVKIYVRLRPSLNEEEWNHNLVICDENNIKIIKSDLDMTYMKFDKIFTSKLQQNDIFQNIDGPIQRFLEGENHSFFAYGQTGAGKTYTMIGDFQETNPFASKHFLTSEHKGILPRALEKVIEYIRTQKQKCTLLGSFYEVYNDKIYDLLNPRTASKREGLELRECKDGTNKIQDLLKIDIKSVEDALQCLRVGLKNRVTGCSHANTKSSRSHSIFQLVLIQEDKENPKNKKTSKLRIVDLAGSEKFKIPKTLDAEERELHILELTSINGSLSALGHCITALTDPKRTHIPFRNSRLTRVLSDSLIGDSKITFIVCLSPSMESAQESLSTLQFASRAKKIILDGRHIRKKEEAIQKNLKVLDKSNNVLELFKQLCSDKTVMSAMVDPAMQSKISLLEREIRDLKMKNQRLQSQVTELKRSYTPETSPYKKSSENLHKEDSKRSTSTNVSPSRGDFRRHASQQDMKRSKENKGSKSVTRIPSMEKKVRFTEDCFTEKVKHEMEYQDNTIFENLSIFREMQDDVKKKQLSVEEIRKMKEQRANYLKFWSDADNEDNNKTPSHNQSEEKSMIFDLISTKGQAKTNLLAQKIKEKEIEKKYEQFFSLDTKQQQQQQPQSNNADLSTSFQGISKPTGPNNSLASVQIQNGLGFGQEDESRRGSRDLPALVYRPKINEDSEMDQNLFSEPHELSLIDHNQNHTIVELTEENFVTDRVPQEFIKIKEDINVNRKFENDYSPLRENQEFNSESGRSDSTSLRDYNSNGLDIIREFDKKLMSVHQLNEQHQELIKNIGIKFAGWQDSDRQLKDKNVYSSKSTINTSNSGRDVNQVVKDIKQELSEALNQIQELKLTDYNTCSTTIFTQEARSQQSLEQGGDDKSSHHSYKSLDRYTWDEGRLRDGNNVSGFQSKGKESKYSSNQGNSKSINDILKKHWSMYKENVK